MFCSIRKFSFLLFLSISWIAAAISAAASPDPQAPRASFDSAGPAEISDPYLTLSWSAGSDPAGSLPLLFELEQAPTERFSEAVLRYQGPDTASFVSGLAEGDYYFRVRAAVADGQSGPWSEPFRVTVEYESLARAFALFGAGAVVSIATVLLVVVGDRRARQEERLL